MSEFHDDFPSYETLAHHSEEEGKTKRKKTMASILDYACNNFGRTLHWF